MSVIAESESTLVDSAEHLLYGSLSGQFVLDGDDAVVIERGEGAHAFAVGGRRYIDYLLGSGPVLLGHAHPAVTQAVSEQLGRGTTFYTLNPQAIALAQQLTEVVPCAEAVRFTCSGSDATFNALRMARVFSGKTKILKFEGGFHGTHDYAIMSAFSVGEPHSTLPSPDSGGIPESIRGEVLVCPWNDVDRLGEILGKHGSELAAVICEPMQRSLVPAPGFLESVRRMTNEHGILLIFDEMVTGFRLSLGGGQQRYGVTPDLATFGKAMTNGFPMTAIAGRRDVIETSSPRRSTSSPNAYFGGTLNGNPMCAAAGLATLGVLRQPGVYPALEARKAELKDSLLRSAANLGLPLQVLGDGPVFQPVFSEKPIRTVRDFLNADRAMGRALSLACLRRGILNSLSKFYVSIAHTAADIEETKQIFDDALAEVAMHPATAPAASV